MVMPMVPLASWVTSGEFWNARPLSWPNVATRAPDRPSKICTPAVVGTMASWYPPLLRSAVTTDPMTCPAVDVRQMVLPVMPLRDQIDPPDPTLVPSSTWSCPLPRISARAGLLVVVPSSVSAQRGVHWAFTSISSLLVEAPPKVAPVPKTMPTLPPISPTAGEDCTVWSVLYWQMRVPALPVGLSTRR